MSSKISPPEFDHKGANYYRARLRLKGWTPASWARARRHSVTTVHSAVHGLRGGPVSRRILAQIEKETLGVEKAFTNA